MSFFACFLYLQGGYVKNSTQLNSPNSRQSIAKELALLNILTYRNTRSGQNWRSYGYFEIQVLLFQSPLSQNKSHAHFLTGCCLREMMPVNVPMHFLQPFAPAQCWNIIGLMSEKNFLPVGGNENRMCHLKYRKNAKSWHERNQKFKMAAISPFLVRH